MYSTGNKIQNTQILYKGNNFKNFVIHRTYMKFLYKTNKTVKDKSSIRKQKLFIINTHTLRQKQNRMNTINNL